MSLAVTFILLTFYFFSVIAIFLGVMSLRGGIRFARYLKSESTSSPANYTPLVSVLVPCRGLEQGLTQNLEAMFAQDYPALEFIFVSDRADDPAFAFAKELWQRLDPRPPVQFLAAGVASDCGQKVHNLRVAISKADPAAEVYVFLDTDARPRVGWLRALVAPLADEAVGAASGYRWFIPVRGGFGSHLRAVWNASIASALGADERKNFCWGGATAIRRTTFEETRVLDYWRGAVSDDFAMTRALHAAGMRIKFVPQCLTPSFEDCSLRELIEFTTRQLKITRVYAPHLWKAVLLGSAVFAVAFFGGITLFTAQAALGASLGAALLIVLILFALGATKSYLRLRAVSRLVANQNSLAATLAHVILWPLASALFLENAIAASMSRRITWRGITYELKSRNETVIIRQQESGVRNRESE